MNLRPALAAAVVDAILEDIYAHGLSASPTENAWIRLNAKGQRAKWMALAEAQLVSHSIPFSGKRRYASEEESVVDAFLTKYPDLRPLLEHMITAALQLDPDACVKCEVTNDPEMCHICQEGQHLCLHVQFSGGYDSLFAHRQDELMNAWIAYPGSHGPSRDPVFHLFTFGAAWISPVIATPVETPVAGEDAV